MTKAPPKALALCMMLAIHSLAAEPRHALLIGNAAYQPYRQYLNKLGPLGNPARRIILVLDACRDHMPLDASKGPGEESFDNIRVDGVEGKETLIAYASSKGETAWGDQASDNSLYTGQLLPALETYAAQPLVLALTDTYSRVVELSSDPNNRNRFPRVQPPRFNAGMKNWCIAPGGCATRPQPIQRAGIATATDAPEPSYAPSPIPQADTSPRQPTLPALQLIDGKSKQELAQLRRHTAQALGIPEVYDEQLADGVAIRFRLIPGGQFTMGSPEGKGYDGERPRHKVTLQPFYMAETELTQVQWRALMGNNPSRFKDDGKPVENVSWNDAMSLHW